MHLTRNGGQGISIALTIRSLDPTLQMYFRLACFNRNFHLTAVTIRNVLDDAAGKFFRTLILKS